MKYVVYVFWVLLLILGVTFSVLNPGKITLNYYFVEQKLYLPLVLLVVLFIGCLLPCLLFAPKLIRQKRLIKKMQRRIKSMESRQSARPTP